MVRDFLKNLRNFFICPVSSHILTLEKNCFFIKAHFLSLPGISDNEVYDWPYHKPSKIKPQMAKLRLELSISLARRVSAHIANSSAQAGSKVHGQNLFPTFSTIDSTVCRTLLTTCDSRMGTRMFADDQKYIWYFGFLFSR